LFPRTVLKNNKKMTASKSSTLLRSLVTAQGAQSSLVSYFVPAGSSIVVACVRDKNNRHAILSALKAVADELGHLTAIPATGTAVFCGECI